MPRSTVTLSAIWGGLIVVVMGIGSCARATPEKLTIAAASNMQFAMADLRDAFTASTGIPCQSIFSSSGKLTAQIQAGAPFDIFLSADLKYPNQLYQQGLTLGKPQIYAYGTLVLWTMNPAIRPSVEVLRHNSISHIGIANPKTAPYGAAAIASLQASQHYESIHPKLVYGESIAQVNQFISTQVVDIGLTAMSVVVSSPFAKQGEWVEIDPTTHPPIVQGVVILQQKRKRLPQAQKFLEFLFSEDAQKVLAAHGYSPKQP